MVLVLLAFFCSVRSQADAQHLRQATDTIGHRDAARKLHIRTGGLLDGQNDAEDLARAAGVFHEENGGAVLHNPDQQDTRAGADNREAIEKALAAGVLAAGWHQERERAPDEIARDAIDAQAQQGVPEGLAKQADTATLLAAGVDAGVHRDLPSFEGTPMPPKRTFREWQDAWLERGGTSPIELTSASFLDPDSPRPGSGYVAACLAARDAHDDISEWVRHHLKLGVYPIYVYDHASVPPMSDVLQPYIAQGDVVYRHFDQYEHPSGKPQLFAFDACLKVNATS